MFLQTILMKKASFTSVMQIRFPIHSRHINIRTTLDLPPQRSSQTVKRAVLLVKPAWCCTPWRWPEGSWWRRTRSRWWRCSGPLGCALKHQRVADSIPPVQGNAACVTDTDTPTRSKERRRVVQESAKCYMDVSQYLYYFRRVGTWKTRFKVVKRHFIQVLLFKKKWKKVATTIREMYQEKNYLLPIKYKKYDIDWVPSCFWSTQLLQLHGL